MSCHQTRGGEGPRPLYLMLILLVTSGGSVNSPLVCVCADIAEIGGGASMREGVVRLQGNLKRAEL